MGPLDSQAIFFKTMMATCTCTLTLTENPALMHVHTFILLLVTVYNYVLAFLTFGCLYFEKRYSVVISGQIVCSHLQETEHWQFVLSWISWITELML